MAEKTDTKVAVLEEKISGMQDLVEARMENLDTKIDHLAGSLEGTILDINSKFEALFSKMDRLHLDMSGHSREVAALVERDKHLRLSLKEVEKKADESSNDLKKFKSSATKYVISAIGSILTMLAAFVWERLSGK